MQANFHTHTKRCGHASGEDRDYIEAALKAGFHTIGFSDHAPFVFPDGYVSKWRVQPEALDDYVTSINALKEEYRGRIQVLLGLEMEYFPALFDEAVRTAKQVGMDYLILSQHAYGNEYDTVDEQIGSPRHAFFKTDREDDLLAYVDQLVAGIQTGVYSYVAHPDGLNFTGDEALYRREMRRLCEAAKAQGLPLEINLLGLSEGRHYPSDRFFAIAGEVGNRVIFGYDAHDPAMFQNEEALKQGEAFAAKHGLIVTEEIPFPLKQR